MKPTRKAALALFAALSLPATSIAQKRTVRTDSRPVSTMRVDTRIVHPIGANCAYEATVRGSYATQDTAHGVVPLRDVHLEGTSSLKCGQQLVRRGQFRVDQARVANRLELAELLRARLTTSVPGSDCTWSPTFAMRAGALISQGVTSSCPSSVAFSSIQPYMRPTTARGGGPVLASPAYCGPNGAVIQRPDRYAPLPFAPTVNPPLEYGTPPANTPRR